MREMLKTIARGVALVCMVPALASFHVRALAIGRDRALEGSTQMLAWLPGIAGQYLRRAFLSQALAVCHPTATVCFGTLFSKSQTRIGEHVYIGPNCHIGLAHIERDVLLAAGVHVPSGRHTHGTDDAAVPIRQQDSTVTAVTIGHGTWIGSAAVVMANVGHDSVIGAGAVVTTPVPANVIAAGVPARVIRTRTGEGAPPAVTG
jgi:virginiamycin A acetyltransferase